VEEIIGSSNRVLEVNLTTRLVSEFKITAEERINYLGGKGLGLKYMYDRLSPGVEPLGAENILAFMVGVFTGTGAPCSGRFAAVTKSPLTGIIVSASCGGPFGLALKTAGYEGLLVSGAAEQPLYLVLNRNDVQFHDASHLWGLDIPQAQRIIDANGGGSLVIGPAGEHQVLYANIASGSRFLGRGGIGAVMGAKKIKAIVAIGKAFKFSPAQPEQFKKVRQKALRYLNRNQVTANEYRNFGTTANVKFCNAGGILPVNNFHAGSDVRTYLVSGETMRTKYHTSHDTCKPCSILCGHKGIYADGREHHIPEYETVALLGPNLGIFDPDIITEWNDQCTRLGLDTISLGGTLAYVMEAGQKGLLKTDLTFGSPQHISAVIEDIAYRRGFGDELAHGSRWLAQKYGGADFAIHVKGLEMGAYDPRGSWGQGLSFAVANRGACHLSATTFALEVFFNFLNPYTVRAKAKFVTFFENLYAAINSLQSCIFTSYAYVLEPPLVRLTPKPLLALTMQHLPAIALKFIDVSLYSKFFSTISGLNLSPAQFLKAGERIHVLERYLNTREGISRKDDTLPRRFLNECRTDDPRQRVVPLRTMLDQYYRQRGFDTNGIPTPELLSRLGII